MCCNHCLFYTRYLLDAISALNLFIWIVFACRIVWYEVPLLTSDLSLPTSFHCTVLHCTALPLITLLTCIFLQGMRGLACCIGPLTYMTPQVQNTAIQCYAAQNITPQFITVQDNRVKYRRTSARNEFLRY